MKEAIYIGKSAIEEGGRVFIIAEAGVNHNGELEKALALVDLAAEIKADAVKFQTFKAEQVVTDKGEMAAYQKKNTGTERKQIDMLRELELPEEFYPALIARCKEKGILFLSTPHGGVRSLEFLETHHLPAYKIGSGDITNYLLLNAVARTNKPIILSTGMSTLNEVKDAVGFIKSRGNFQIIVLHCTSNYPCPDKDVNMAAMKTLMGTFDVPVGFSDHTEGDEAAIMASTLGMALYEFHITLDKKLPGPDHIASTNPKEAKRRVDVIRKTHIMMGSPVKAPTPDELKLTLPIARKSLVAARDLKKGHVLTFEDLEAKRPADGVSPIHFGQFMGKKLKRDMQRDEQLNTQDINNSE